MVNVCGGCLPHAGCCLQHLCQLINSLQNWYPPRLRTSIAHFRQGSCRVGQGLPQVCGRAGLAGLGPRSLAPRCVLPCGSALGVGPSPRRSAPAPGQPRSPPSTCMTPDTGHTGEVRVGWEGGCWPEEPGRSRGWLCAERPGVRQGEAASLGQSSAAHRCVWRWGARRGPRAPASCSHP